MGAAGRGVTQFAGWNSGGYGNLVIVQHRLGFQTWYAHLSRATSYPGEVVTGGTRIGYVGSTGHSTGPHLHFEVRLNGTPINPLPRLARPRRQPAPSRRLRPREASAHAAHGRHARGSLLERATVRRVAGLVSGLGQRLAANGDAAA